MSPISFSASANWPWNRQSRRSWPWTACPTTEGCGTKRRITTVYFIKIVLDTEPWKTEPRFPSSLPGEKTTLGIYLDGEPRPSVASALKTLFNWLETHAVSRLSNAL
jgi:hypothetical protein